MAKEILKVCEKCGKPILIRINIPMCGCKEVATKCDCDIKIENEQREKEEFEDNQRKIETLKNLSLIDKKLKGARLYNFKISDENRKAYEISKKYIERFDEMYEKNQGLIFWGNVGTGKSYTAAMIANELLERMNPVIMTSFVKILQEKNINDENYLNNFNNAKLVVIDDFGAERCTDFALEKVYNIIDSRYRSGKPLILTTNNDLRDMKCCSDIRYNRIYDRIFEMCYPIKIEGMSWRKKEAITRFENMKKFMEE